MPRPRKLIIKKEDTETDTATETTATTSGYTETETTDTGVTETDTGTVRYTGNQEYVSIVDVDYQAPKTGTKQENFTEEQVRASLEGYIPLKTIEDKEVLKTLPLFKTWVKYINAETGKYRIGGLLMKVVYPTYITLANTAQSVVWSVQLKDNIIFIRHPLEVERRRIEKEKADAIKDQLYNMYVNGELKRNE